MKKPIRRKKNIQSLSKLKLDKWEKAFWSVYREKDLERPLSLMWLSVHQYASEIGEAVRKSEHRELLDSIAHTFCWINSFMAKCNFDENINPLFRLEDSISDVIAFKYPNSCGHCLCNPCTCGLKKRKLEFEKDKLPDYKELLKRREEFKSDYKRWTLDRWITMFQSIYGNAIYASTLETICLHFFEEVGEAATLIRRLIEKGECAGGGLGQDYLNIEGLINLLSKRTSKEIENVLLEKIKLTIEIADSFAWLCSIFIKMQFMYEGIEKLIGKPVVNLFSDTIINEYKHPKKSGVLRCPDCNRTKCKCHFLLPQNAKFL
jgi:NTP pyrophosphatase (non-canonical NTP hydrolase)